MKKYLFLFILFFYTFLTVKAQPDCNNNLDVANKLYNLGRFDEAIGLITTCSEIQKNDVTKWQSLHLLSQCYLGKNDVKMAKAAAEDMLDKNPLYKTSLIEDSKEFYNLIKDVKVVPRFTLSLSTAVGLKTSYPNVIKSYGITTDKKDYTNKKSKQIAIISGYAFSDKLSIHSGILFVENNYSLKYSVQQLNFKYSETLNYLQIPILARYQIIKKGNFKVFTQAGFFTGFLTKAKYDIERTDKVSLENAKLKNIESIDSRTKNINGMLGGLGVSYKLREGHVFAEINYQYSFTNLNQSEKRLSNDNLIYNYFFVDDDLRINNLTLSIGYTFYLNYFVQRAK